jgi:hypothetical protein
MPTLNIQTERATIRKAILDARRLAAMLQGTMGLEGQGLDRKSLRAVKKQMTRRLLGTRP